MDIVFYLHSTVGLLLIAYILLPFLITTLKNGSEEMAKVSVFINRVGMYILIVAFLSGGYLISQVEGITVPWMIVVILLLLVMFAMTGMISKPLKRVRDGSAIDSDHKKAKMFSFINAIALVFILVLMYNPTLL
ncbi:hypothetical protein [Chengkuizengella axinellae]|uniref:DUF2269 family protein n=1 Tax=Chengkuizengella axinellae TaxID=3064388 RepID=A0ABT9IYI6_9BACL|nr:hypothetical protein [Chengkuizengella sp. 2205SS18-9]MDP5274418.1 hypothetical protein [Chengkuizengella sp. 2205SS18-9]